MANFLNSFGTSDAGAQQLGNTLFQQVSPTTDKTFAGLLQQALSAVPSAAPSFESVTQQGTQSPLLQQIIGPLLAALQPGQDQARQAQTDAFRAAGGLRGSAYGQAVPRLEGELARQQGSTISQTLLQYLPQIVSGLGQQFSQQMAIPHELLNALSIAKPSIVTGTPQNQVTSSTGYGGGGGSFGPSAEERVATAQTSFDDMIRRLRGTTGTPGTPPPPTPPAPPNFSDLASVLGGYGGGGSYGGSPSSIMQTGPSSWTNYSTKPGYFPTGTPGTAQPSADLDLSGGWY